MKKNILAVAVYAVAFLFPVQSFADIAKVGDVKWGFRFDKRLNDMTNLWEPRNIEVLDKNKGITGIMKITKVFCVLDECFYRSEYLGEKGKNKEMLVFDIEDIFPKNSGNKKISMGDKDVAENAKKLGIEKEKLKKALEDENEYQKLLREIQVKKEQQRRQEEEKEKNNGTTGNGGGSSGGGGRSGLPKGNEYFYFNKTTGIYADTIEGACAGISKDGMLMRRVEHPYGYKYCQMYVKGESVEQGHAMNRRPYIEYAPFSLLNSDCLAGADRKFVPKSGGTFSVVCTYKHKPKEESSTVGSTGSTGNQNSQSSSPNSSSAGGGGGGGRSGADHATTPDGGMQGGGKNGGSGQDGTTGSGGGGGGQGGTTGSGGGGGGQGGMTGSGGSGTTSTTGGNGSGGGGGGQDSELPDVPDSPFGNGDGEPDWGRLKSNGDFGSFRPSSAFSIGGACPQDLTLDFGQFGVHQLSMSYVCMAVEKLRYVFIFMAYFFSAMMVFKTVNSMKG